MIHGYKIENGKAITSHGAMLPDGFIEYEKGSEPQELLNGLAELQDEAAAVERLQALKATDTDMVRLLAEDIIPQLVANGSLVLENLDQAAQDKLADRATKRANL
jgi:hypothetical protein